MKGELSFLFIFEQGSTAFRTWHSSLYLMKTHKCTDNLYSKSCELDVREVEVNRLFLSMRRWLTEWANKYFFIHNQLRFYQIFFRQQVHILTRPGVAWERRVKGRKGKRGKEKQSIGKKKEKGVMKKVIKRKEKRKEQIKAVSRLTLTGSFG